MALQIIVGIEKKFDYVIEDDDIAIKVVDTPLKFLAMYLEGNNNE